MTAIENKNEMKMKWTPIVRLHKTDQAGRVVVYMPSLYCPYDHICIYSLYTDAITKNGVSLVTASYLQHQ